MTKLYTTDYVLLPHSIRGVQEFENDESDESGGERDG